MSDWPVPATPETALPAGPPPAAFLDPAETEANGLEALAADVERIEGLLQDVYEALGTLEGVSDANVKLIDKRLTAIEDRTGRGHWAPDVEDDFDEFVGWLEETYYLRSTLHGWQDNSALVRELWSLHIAWRHVCSPDAGPFDALAWHDHLARVVDRLNEHRTRERKHTNPLPH